MGLGRTYLKFVWIWAFDILAVKRVLFKRPESSPVITNQEGKISLLEVVSNMRDCSTDIFVSPFFLTERIAP